MTRNALHQPVRPPSPAQRRRAAAWAPFLFMLAVILAAACDALNFHAGQDACNHNPQIIGCGAGGQPGGVMLTCLVQGQGAWECNVWPPSPAAASTQPISHIDPSVHLCGSVYCATGEADARTKSGADGDPNLSCVPFDVASNPPTWMSCIPANGNADSGIPCAELGGYCENGLMTGGMAPRCCDTTVFVPGSRLACDTDFAVTDIGACAIREGNPCTDDSQCAYRDIVYVCHLGVCCQPENSECFVGPTSENAVTDNDGCCLDTKCLPDAIGNGFSCQ